MDSKHTRVIAPSLTKKASSTTARVSTTVKPSQELKNTSLCRAHQLGINAENLVAQDFIVKKFKILNRRFRTIYAEIDLIVESPRGEIWLVEVKTISHFDFLEVRVSKKQKERLQRAHLSLQVQTKKIVRLIFAFVDRDNKITTIENI